jgi:hypothetical protein
MEDHEKKEGELDIEQALERLDSSEEALDLEEGEVAFAKKWVAAFAPRLPDDWALKQDIADYTEKRDIFETKAVLQACVAAGGAGLAMFGIHDDLAQYMDENTFWVAENLTSRLAGGGTMLLAALASWNNFKDSFKMGERITKLRNQGA